MTHTAIQRDAAKHADAMTKVTDLVERIEANRELTKENAIPLGAVSVLAAQLAKDFAGIEYESPTGEIVGVLLKRAMLAASDAFDGAAEYVLSEDPAEFNRYKAGESEAGELLAAVSRVYTVLNALANPPEVSIKVESEDPHMTAEKALRAFTDAMGHITTH